MGDDWVLLHNHLCSGDRPLVRLSACPFIRLFVRLIFSPSCKNYVFYRVEPDCIYVVNIYNEREDFMMDLFGIKTTSKGTEDFRGE